MKNIGFATVLTLVLATCSAAAQTAATSFDELKKQISVGDTVRVTDNAANVFNGKVKEISAGSLMLKGRKAAIPADSIQLVEKRRNDTILNGLLIGAGVGLATGFAVAKSQCSNDSECDAIATVVFVPSGMAIGMVAGALIDRSIVKYEKVFAAHGGFAQFRLHLSPFISPKQKGVLLSIAF